MSKHLLLRRGIKGIHRFFQSLLNLWSFGRNLPLLIQSTICRLFHGLNIQIRSFVLTSSFWVSYKFAPSQKLNPQKTNTFQFLWC